MTNCVVKKEGGSIRLATCELGSEYSLGGIPLGMFEIPRMNGFTVQWLIKFLDKPENDPSKNEFGFDGLSYLARFDDSTGKVYFDQKCQGNIRSVGFSQAEIPCVRDELSKIVTVSNDNAQ